MNDIYYRNINTSQQVFEMLNDLINQLKGKHNDENIQLSEYATNNNNTSVSFKIMFLHLIFENNNYLFDKGEMILAISMEGCKLGHGMHDCELDHIHNFHHDGNIGNFLSPKAVGYCDNTVNTEKFLYNVFEFKNIETKQDIEGFSIGISTAEIKKYLSLNYKKYGNNKFINITSN